MPAPRSLKRTVVAILLSGLILPGLGQLYLGRRIRGIVLIMVTNLLLLVSLFFMMKISSPLIGAHLTGTPLTPDLILENIQPYATWAKVLLVAYLVVWGAGLVDLLNSLRTGEDITQN